MHLFTRNRRRNLRTGDRRRPVSLALRLELLETRCLLSSSTPTSYGQLPLSFEPNVGQAAAGTEFIVRSDGAELGLAHGTLSVAIQAPSPTKDSPSSAASVLDFRLVGANAAPEAQTVDALAGVSNYLIGNDPAKWHRNIPTYGGVDYADVYPGIDLNFHGQQGQLEYDFVVNAGAQPGAIRFQLQGAQSWSLDAAGDLVLHTTGADVVEKAPIAYQERNGGRQEVAARFVLQDNGSVGFAVGAYDASLPLTIDPVLAYSTYLGGSADDKGNGIAIDSSGSAYVVGSTLSSNFPIVNDDEPYNAGHDIFVAKLNPAGNGLVYSTYLGGSADDFGYAIAVDSSGSAYVAGVTTSNDFPAVNGVKGTLSGMSDAVVAKLNPAGNGLVYGSYLGGTGSDTALAITVDASGAAYLAGTTNSTDFPTPNALQNRQAGVADAFILKLNPAGSALVYSTYLGGSGNDQANGIAVDGAGNAYETGTTNSANFPIVSAFQANASGGGGDAFVAKLNASGTALVFSTYLGGTGPDGGQAIAVDSAGSAYVAGTTFSKDFPTTANAFQTNAAASAHAFVTKLNPKGNGLVYSTYLGGNQTDFGNGIAVDASGEAYVTGYTASSNFPTANAAQGTYGGGGDAFFTRLNANGTGLVYSTYVGGSGGEQGNAIAVDAAGNAYIAGFTASADFPTLSPLQATNAGGNDAFVTKFAGHIWQGQDVTVGSDGKTRILWNTPTGQIDVWSVSNSFAAAGGPAYGPINGWLPVETAAGPDRLTRVLWRNSDNGAAALWLLAPDGSFVNVGVFGPFAGWTAQDVAVGADNVTRVLWTNTSGQVDVWRVDNAFNVTASPVFGPYAGWSAVKLAIGSDALIRLLWTQADGTTALWLLNADGTFNSATVFGPIQGWQAIDITVGLDNNTRILWVSSSGAAAVWSMSNSFAVIRANVFGPFAGWAPVAIEAGGDGLTRLLWNYIDGTTALWLLGADGSFVNAATFGPF